MPLHDIRIEISIRNLVDEKLLASMLLHFMYFFDLQKTFVDFSGQSMTWSSISSLYSSNMFA